MSSKKQPPEHPPFDVRVFTGGITMVAVDCDEETGETRTLLPAAPAADWDLWAAMPKAEAWQLVALSLDKEPGEWDKHFADHFDQWASRMVFGEEFWPRWMLTRGTLGATGPLQPIEMFAGVLTSPKALLRMIDFGTWATALGWTLPAAFPRSSAAMPFSDIPKRVWRAGEHERSVLDALVSTGFDPLALPNYPNGRPSPARQAARNALLSRRPPMTTTQFKKTWQALLDAGQIKQAK